jgi:hypothetical protein
MANYPTLPLDADSRITPVDQGRRDVTAAGVRTRQLSSLELYELRANHSYITQAQAESVYDLWATDPTATVTIAWRDGYDYDCVFDGPPEVDRDYGANRWWAKARLLGERQP